MYVRTVVAPPRVIHVNGICRACAWRGPRRFFAETTAEVSAAREEHVLHERVVVVLLVGCVEQRRERRELLDALVRARL